MQIASSFTLYPGLHSHLKPGVASLQTCETGEQLCLSSAHSSISAQDEAVVTISLG